MLLLHGGSNAYRGGLLILQHVSEALKVGGKKRKEVKERDRGYTKEGGGGRVPYQVNSHYMDVATQTVVAVMLDLSSICWHSFSLSIK